jgi:fatty-acyl-CoA synthase
MNSWFGHHALGMLPAMAARQWPANEALVFGDRRWTYAQFNAEVDRAAVVLIDQGVESGEHVALWVTNCPEFIFLFFAILKIGAVAIPLNTRYRKLDLEFALQQSDAATLLTVDQAGPVNYGAMVHDAVGPLRKISDITLSSEKFPSLKRIAVIGTPVDLPGARAWAALLRRPSRASMDELHRRASKVEAESLAIIMYTSGTTGNPKGVMLNHALVRLCTERALATGITQNDVLLNYLPLFHAYGLAYIGIQCVLTGAKHILMETFDAFQAVRLVKAEKVTMLHGFDTHFRDLIAQLDGSSSIDLSTLRVGHLAAGLENVVAVAREVQKLLCPTVAGYGMTETGGAATHSPLDANLDQRTHASGYPLPGVEVRILDPNTGREAETGTQGEILVRSYCNMMGYYKLPKATAEAIDEHGWLHTGDAGILRPDGHLRFVGRYKDMLKVGGENVSPAEIEILLQEMPGIAQVAAVGCPDLRLNEVVAVFVVPRNASTVTLGQVDEFCRGKIASYKIPRRLILIDELPMTSSGKVRKNVLREKLLQPFAKEES